MASPGPVRMASRIPSAMALRRSARPSPALAPLGAQPVALAVQLAAVVVPPVAPVAQPVVVALPVVRVARQVVVRRVAQAVPPVVVQARRAVRSPEIPGPGLMRAH